jgi:4-amino-4-deoxy-L-arabinose transferase-like glycosyltransferase
MSGILSQFFFLLVHYFYFGALAACSYVVGHALIHRVSFASAWERLALSMALGLGIISHILFVLGQLGLLLRMTVVAALLVWVIGLNWHEVRRLSGALLRVPSRTTLVALGVVLFGCLVAAPILCLPLYPPHDWDATELYLASAKIYVEQHALVVTPYLRFEVYPQLCQLLFALGMMFADDLAAQLTHFLMLVLTAVALIAWGHRAFSSRAGWWAGALFLGSPIAIWLGSTAYIDLGVALFVTVAVYCLYVWLQGEARVWLLLCAAFCGFAASTKYTALPVIALIGVVVLSVALWRRRGLDALGFSALLIAVGAPSYLRNFIYSGNPLFPLLPGIFGYGNFNAEDVRGVMQDLRNNYGIGRHFASLVTLPWQVAFHPERFHAEAGLSKVYFFALPVLAIGCWRNRRIRFLGCAVLALTAYWFFNAQILRHFIIVLPILSLATAASLDWLAQLPGLPRRLMQSRVLWVGVALVLVFPGWRYAWFETRRNGALPVTVQARDAFLTRTHVSYPAYAELNRERGGNYSLYALADTDMAYFTDGLFMGDWFGPARYLKVLNALGGGEALRHELSSLGAEFFLVNQLHLPVTLPDDEAWRSHFLPVYARDGVFLFRLVPTNLRYEVMENRLKNPGFDELVEGRPVGWELAGTARVEREPGGEIAIAASAGINCPHQRVAVLAGAVYRFGFRARAERGDQKARFQVNYLRGDGEPAVVDATLASVAMDWASYQTTTVAPAGAREAEVYGCTDNRSAVVFDDLSFREVRYLDSVGRFR